MPKRITLEELQVAPFGRLRVIRETDPWVYNTFKTRRFVCMCECGNEVTSTISGLRSGDYKSCGCLNRGSTHGATRKGSHLVAEYRVWNRIKRDCYNPRSKKYRYYGAKGIKVCNRWLESFENFLMDMGKRPSSRHSIERIDGKKDYEPSNCRWDTITTQNRNRSNVRKLEFNGEVRSIPEWAEITGFASFVIYSRLRSGFSIERALTKPLRRKLQKHIS